MRVDDILDRGFEQVRFVVVCQTLVGTQLTEDPTVFLGVGLERRELGRSVLLEGTIVIALRSRLRRHILYKYRSAR